MTRNEAQQAPGAGRQGAGTVSIPPRILLTVIDITAAIPRYGGWDPYFLRGTGGSKNGLGWVVGCLT